MSAGIKSAPPNELRFVLIGKTGVGKSRVGNTLVGSNAFTYAADSSAITKFCKLVSADRFGNKIDVVDTPGIFELEKDNLTVQKEICRCISMTTPGPHAILFCVKMNRSTAEGLKVLNHFIRHFGTDLEKHLIFVFTHLDTWKEDFVDNKQPIPPVESYIGGLPKELTSYLNKCGNRYICFNNRSISAEKDDYVRKLVSIVEEMNKTNKEKFYTDEMYKAAEEILQSMADVNNIRDKLKQSDFFLEKVFLHVKLVFHKLYLKWKQKGPLPPEEETIPKT